jgi:hypothetical protein
MGGMSTRNEIKARLGILAEPKVAMTRPNAKAKFDSLAKFKAKVVQLVTMLGFKPDEITGNSEMVHVLFMDKPGQADRLAIALRRNLAQVGVPASAITTHEHRYADDDTTYGGVWVDVRALANAKSRASRPGAKVKSGRAEQVMRDGTVHLDFRAAKEWLSGVTDSALRYIISDAQQAAKAMPEGSKWNYYHDLSLTAQDELQRRKKKASRPGAKAKMDKNAALAIVGKAIAGVPAGAQRDALQKALIDYYDNTQAANRLLKQGNTQDANRFAVEAGRAAQIAVRTWDRMGKPAAELRGFTQNLERAAEFARPGAKSTHAAADKPGRKVMAESDPAVSAKIRKLMAEGKPQKQAVAIALDMKRRGEI